MATANQKENRPEDLGEARVVEDEKSDGELFVISNGNSKICEDWILDLACTFHMSFNKDWFTIYEVVLRGAMIMENNFP